jgi:hypothetical protein
MLISTRGSGNPPSPPPHRTGSQSPISGARTRFALSSSGPEVLTPKPRQRWVTESVWCGQAATKQDRDALRYASAADCRQVPPDAVG